MFVPATFAAALAMTIISTCCWGSFANTFKLTKNYRFELYYWDYGLGIFVMSVVWALTLGSAGGGPLSFLANLPQADGVNLLYAALGGFIFNIANVLLIAGIEMIGLAVAFPISIGIALVEGVVLSYLLRPQGSAALLAAGVGMGVLAVILVGMSYGALRQTSREGASVSRKGVWTCIISGLLMGIFAPFVTKAMSSGHTLTPYTTAVLLTLGAFVCCFVFNPILMRRPLVGTPVSFAGYRAAPMRYHLLGLAGGLIWGTGAVFNFVAANKVGVPISYAIGQASPMIATAWGVFVWGEFKGANARARIFLTGMFAAYALALVLIAKAYAG